MNVFVLCTGRCGSYGFAKACSTFTNYTAGHETNVHEFSHQRRFAYPDQHIEVDNRLAWFLGALPDTNVRYVWLRRERRDVVASFMKRSPRAGIVNAFANGIVVPDRPVKMPDLDATIAYVATVEDNIASFLRQHPHFELWIEYMDDLNEIEEFMHFIRAEGDPEAFRAEISERHNAGRAG